MENARSFTENMGLVVQHVQCKHMDEIHGWRCTVVTTAKELIDFDCDMSGCVPVKL